MKELNDYIFTSDLKQALELIEKGADINAKYGVGIRPISAAINSDEPDTLRFVIGHGADVNIDNGHPLFEAIDLCIDGMIQNGRAEPYPEAMEMFKILIENGADIGLKDEKGNGPLKLLLSYPEKDQTFFRPYLK